MENPPSNRTRLTEMFARWRKDPWPMPTGMHEPVAGGQAWEGEGGTIKKPPIAPGPKLPL
jgi:hypothetical protein